jgi:hypothetical protein
VNAGAWASTRPQGRAARKHRKHIFLEAAARRGHMKGKIPLQ